MLRNMSVFVFEQANNTIYMVKKLVSHHSNPAHPLSLQNQYLHHPNQGISRPLKKNHQPLFHPDPPTSQDSKHNRHTEIYSDTYPPSGQRSTTSPSVRGPYTSHRGVPDEPDEASNRSRFPRRVAHCILFDSEVFATPCGGHSR